MPKELLMDEDFESEFETYVDKENLEDFLQSSLRNATVIAHEQDRPTVPAPPSYEDWAFTEDWMSHASHE